MRWILFRSLGELIHFVKQVHQVDTACGGIVVHEAQDGGGFQDDAFHHAGLDVAVFAIEFIDHRLGVATKHADPDFAFLEILSDFDRTDGNEFSAPFIISLHDGADFAAEQFVDLIETSHRVGWL